MTAIAQALSAALLDFVWQGLLAAFLLWTALFVLKNHSARARYAASSVALVAMASPSMSMVFSLRPANTVAPWKLPIPARSSALR